MGCGCKNKNNGQQTTVQQPVQTQQQQTNESVKSVITKVVEKYYTKK
jgi:hypothetical protein